MLHETSLLLSRITTHAAVVIGPQPDTARVRSVQLVRLHETSLLVVAVLSQRARRAAVHRAGRRGRREPHRRRHRRARQPAARRLLHRPARPPGHRRPGHRRARHGQARDALVARSVDGRASEPVYVGGASRIAADLDAFTAGETVGRLLEVLEHQYLVVSLVRDLIDQGVTVRIGAENQLEDLRECSVVLARFDVEGRPGGSVGVLGPDPHELSPGDGGRGRRLPPPRRTPLPARLTDADRLLRGARRRPGGERRRDQEGLPAASPASTTPTPTTVTRPPRPASRRSASPTRRCATRRSGAATTCTAPRAWAPAPGPGAGGFDFGVSDLFDAFFGAGFGGGRRAGRPDPGPRRRGPPDPRPRRGGLRRDEARRAADAGRVRALHRVGLRAGHPPVDLPHLRRGRRGPHRAPHDPGPDDDRHALHRLPGDGPGDPLPLPRLPGRRAGHAPGHRRGPGAGRHRRRAAAPPVRPGPGRPPGRRARRPLRVDRACGPTPGSSATATTSSTSCACR